MSDDVAEAPRFSTTSTLRNLLEHPDLQMPVSRLRDGDNKKEGSWDDSFDTTAALLGPNLWDKNVSSYQDEFKMEYVDLDEFFTENGMGLPATDLATLKPSPGPHLHHHHHHHHHHQPTQSQSASAPPVEKPSAQPLVHSPPVPHVPSLPSPPVEQALPAFQKGEIKTEPVSDNETLYGKLACDIEQPRSCRVENDCKVRKVELKFSPADLALASSPGEDDFDPQSHTFSEEELKPQPMVKKSRKQFVPDDLKDDRYWARRRKNNLAAKRSRDARRVKENQIALRASFLEKENFALRKEIDQLRKENSLLKSRLLKLEDC